MSRRTPHQTYAALQRLAREQGRTSQQPAPRRSSPWARVVRTTDLSRVKRLGVRAAERPDRPSLRAVAAFDAGP